MPITQLHMRRHTFVAWPGTLLGWLCERGRLCPSVGPSVGKVSLGSYKGLVACPLKKQAKSGLVAKRSLDIRSELK